MSQAGWGALLSSRMRLYSLRMPLKPGLLGCKGFCVLSSPLLLLLLLCKVSSGPEPLCLAAAAPSLPLQLSACETLGVSEPCPASSACPTAEDGGSTRNAASLAPAWDAAACGAAWTCAACIAERVAEANAAGGSVAVRCMAALRVASLHSDRRAEEACICLSVAGNSNARTPACVHGPLMHPLLALSVQGCAPPLTTFQQCSRQCEACAGRL